MGFERLVRVLQQKQSNYDTDVFSGTIAEIEKSVGKKYDASDSKEAVAFRVLADHIRAISFTIADGQLPSNTGAGYVIRRILRRAVRYYYSYLNYQQPLLFHLVPVIATQFEAVFPELKQQESFVRKVVHEEEEAFLRTLGKAIDLFYENVADVFRQPAFPISINIPDELRNEILNSKEKLQSQYENLSQLFEPLKDLINKNKNLNITLGELKGNFAFKLQDTYGLPKDLTKLMASELAFKVNEEEYKNEMMHQKERSRAATVTDAGDWTVLQEGGTQFIGYEALEAQASILRYRTVKKGGKESYQVVLDRTPFYAESGGQVGDMGVLKSSGAEIKIIDTKKENDLIIHIAERLPNSLDGDVTAIVDRTRRQHTAMHHSATHLLHAALRTVLGTHVAQKGSLVAPDYLRFDFSHFSKVTDEELQQIEQLVNEKIRENNPVVVRYMPKEEAMQSGAMALFGEKYGDTVRVVTIDPSYSVELCGGTHIGSTGELGFFKITSESAVAAGVRRMEAVSGIAAETFLHGELKKLEAVRAVLKNPKDPIKAIQNLQDENTALQKRIEQFEAAQLKTVRDGLLKKVQTINAINFIGAIVDVNTADALKKLAFDLKPQLKDYVIALAAAVEGKAHVVLLFDDAVAAQRNLDAAATIKTKIAPLIKGGGGGQKTLATAGGQNAADLQAVIDVVKNML
jgi:alanyl-tRNA synthetase